ncbi:MAG: hypothetical protein PHX51_03075 [Clostridia bacterium]|nr:hypothetical protein [Clostridia bacterium]
MLTRMVTAVQRITKELCRANDSGAIFGQARMVTSVQRITKELCRENDSGAVLVLLNVYRFIRKDN